MKKTISLILFSVVLLNASEYIWSKETPSLSKSKSEQIFQSYENGNDLNITFEDDPKKNDTIHDYSLNALVLGFSVGGISYTETLSNSIGSSSESYTSYNAAFLIGKDFTLWHDDYSQPSRLYFKYGFSKINEELDFTTWSIGLRENMYYWSIYETDKSKIYPNASFELGSSKIKRNSESQAGFTLITELGLTYMRNKNFEYFFNLSYNSVTWKHPIDGITDQMNGIGANFGLNYKIMHGDFQ